MPLHWPMPGYTGWACSPYTLELVGHPDYAVFISTIAIG